MNRKIYFFAWVVIMGFALVQCKKDRLAKDTPDCIRSKISSIQSEQVRNPPASVWQYDYNGKTVYYIPSYCCDMYSELYDEDCNLICNPDGGISGSGDGRCNDFSSKRKKEKLIWKDNR